ncbi:MAG: hypothetical protein HY894_02260 [Deltaproteobacteria bacterium]|nr:hypothetical protein [Deltaproteobacteria bacterium]
MKRRTYILGAAAIGPLGDTTEASRRTLKADPATADLSNLVLELTGQEMRRAGHFTELAIAGAGLAVRRAGARLDPLSPLFFATGLGEVHNTVALFKQVMEGGAGSTSPYAFVNSVSNTAAFQVAKSAGLVSPNLTFSQEEFSFECALRFAAAEIEDGLAAGALVGGTDELSHPRHEHIKRLPLKEGEIMGEGCGWLRLGSDGAGAIGEALGVVELQIDAGEEWAAALCGAIGPWIEEGVDAFLMPGFRMDGAETAALAGRLDAGVKDYLKYCGCFHTASAFGLASVFDGPRKTEAVYVHVNRNAEGRAICAGIKAYPTPLP